VSAPSWICSEHHPSLKSGENWVQNEYAFKNLVEIKGIVKKLEYFQNLKGTSQIPYDYMKTLPLLLH